MIENDLQLKITSDCLEQFRIRHKGLINEAKLLGAAISAVNSLIEEFEHDIAEYNRRAQ